MSLLSKIPLPAGILIEIVRKNIDVMYLLNGLLASCSPDCESRNIYIIITVKSHTFQKKY